MSTMVSAAADSQDAVNNAPTLSGRARFWRRLRRQRLAMIALIYIIVLILAAVFAAQVAPKDPNEQNLRAALQGPSLSFLLGTDNLGRDTLSRVIFGARLALLASAQAVSIAFAIGVPVGLAAGYFGGRLDRAVMWINDIFLSLPALIIAFAIVAVLGQGLANAMIAVGLVLSTRYVRLTRGVVLAEREELYVDAAKVVGVRTPQILFRHILPNIASPLIVQTSLLCGVVILLEASLSFIGLGAPVGTSSWGRMLEEARIYFGRQPFLAIPPGIAITLTVLAFNIFGDGLRDAVGREASTARLNTKAKTLANNGPPVACASVRDVELAEATSPAVLSIRNLEVHFPTPRGTEVAIMHDVSLEIMPGETLGLVGESGSGKSMTALAVLGLVPLPGCVTNGSIRLRGRELVGLSEGELQCIRGNEIAMIFQDPLTALDPAFTIGDQIAEPLRVHKGMSGRQAMDRAAELLARVGVPDPTKRLRDYPHQFSGGMAQRVLIARALSCDPTLLIADEPTTALDVTIQGQVLDLLRDLQNEFGMTMLFITHNLGVVADVCDRAAVMYAGEIVETGSVVELMERPHHPYTAALLGAMPQNQRRSAQLTNIKGQVPSAWAWPAGCRFHPRCSLAGEQCKSVQAGLVEVEPGRMSRCVKSTELVLQGAV